ncbi:HAD-IIA family hydrolase [Streptosporangium sp. NPDC000396]|uniref:HAD-IIA family hydrolase n=1 Tax=Streptosporangium sp. NPDC000396 TaxID=3366185 RepID=UPI0036932B9F
MDTETLIDPYDTLLLDLDGVVYLGREAVPGAPEALREAARRGVRLAYVTNNASRTSGAIAEHLSELGAPATPEDVVTSAQAAARLVAERVEPGAAVLVVGGMGLRSALRAHGLRPVSTAMDAPVAVVQGIAPNLSYGLLSEGALAVRQGALFVAANADLTMPTGRGELPGNGAMSRVIAAATGVEPIVAGKPEPPLHRESILRTGSERPLVVGDRLDTDIEGASNAGVDSLLVLTGVASALDLLTAAPRHRPAYVAADLSALHRPYPQVLRSEGGWTCEGWIARWVEGRLRLDGQGDPLDGLRAACAATWEAAGEGRAEEDAVKAVLHSSLPDARSMSGKAGDSGRERPDG